MSRRELTRLYKFFLIPLVASTFIISTIRPSFAQGNYENEQPYRLVKNPAVDSTAVKKLLIVSSIEPRESEFFETYNEKIERLSEIIRSHWDVEIEIIDVAQYRQGYIGNFDALFFIEEYGRIVPYSLFSDLANSVDKEIVWSGFGSEELIASLLRRYLYLQTKPVEITDINYKSVSFSLGEINYLGSFILPENSDRNEVLATFTDANGEGQPLILDIDHRFLILPFEMPFSYSACSFRD